MQQSAGMADLMRNQMMMTMGMSMGMGKNPLTSFIGLSLYDKIMSSYPKWFPYFEEFCCRRKRLEPSTPAPPSNKPVRATIECERVLRTSGKQGNSPVSASQSRMDSVVHYVSTIPAIRNLLCMNHHDYLPNEYEPIMVENDIYFQLTGLKHNEGELDGVKFRVFCYDHESQYLRDFVERCNADYERKQANKLGTSLYYFDMMTATKHKKSTQNTLPTTHLIYSKHKFYTTRTFDNVFFEQRSKVRKHVEFFLTRKDWYEKKGIPYTLGFMFHGDPGCGKTSSVKAIANTARRHIINIHLSQIKTKAQLTHLFYNDDIYVYDGSKTEKYTIPIHERLYVIEDIDAMGDAIMSRNFKKPEPKKEKTADEAWAAAHAEDEPEQIDLSFLLNLLDGTLESSGRIIAISSNYPERIDKALIRPGRIDMIVQFRKCNRQILQEMVTSFYDKEMEDWTTPELEYVWTPAEVNKILFRNFDKPEDAINELKTLKPRDLYGFDTVAPTASYTDFAGGLDITQSNFPQTG
jgi:hypothetical protein